MFKDICEIVGLKHVNGTVTDKAVIKENIFYQNYKEMKKYMTRYTKLEEVQCSDFREIQNYMELKWVAKVQLAFRIRSKMVKNSKLNFKLCIEI